MDWYWTRNSIQSCVPSGKTIEYSSSLWSINYFEKMVGAIEFWRWKVYLRNDFENSQHWSDEMWKSRNAGRRRQQEKISILHWFVRIRNSLSPRTQSHWSNTTGQCVNSGRFLQSFIFLDVQSIYTPSQIQDWYRTKFKSEKTDNILYGCEYHGQGTQISVQAWFDRTKYCITSCLV